jgi:hypothetical protein
MGKSAYAFSDNERINNNKKRVPYNNKERGPAGAEGRTRGRRGQGQEANA